MHKRVVGLALVALAVVLSGCRVTVISGPAQYAAPGSLVGYRLVLTNSTRTGGVADEQETYLFKSASVASRAGKAGIGEARSWTYQRQSNHTAMVTAVFPLSGATDLTIECNLTFDSSWSGTHKCEYAHRTSTMIADITVKGAGEGTFRIDKIPQDPPAVR